MTARPVRALAPLIVIALTGCAQGSASATPKGSVPATATASPAPTPGAYGGATAVIPMAGGPRGVAWAGGAIWVASGLGNLLQRVDPATNEVVAEIDVGLRPITLVTVGDELWVSVLNGDDVTDDELVRIDTATNEATSRVLVPVHHNIAVGGGLIWVQDTNGQLRSVDPATGVVTDVVATGIGPVALAASEDAVYGIRSTGAAWRWPIGGGGLGEGQLGTLVPGRSRVAANDAGVWVAVPGKVLALDPASLAIRSELSLPKMSLVNDLWLDGTSIWLSANVSSEELGLRGGSVLQLDPDTLEIRGTWRLGPESSGVVVADGSIWAVDQADNLLARYPFDATP
jgi:streptogramin lyase